MNRENFERVKAAILANPETFHMAFFARPDAISPCGTVGCIAGFCDWLMAVDGEAATVFGASGAFRQFVFEDRDIIRRAEQFLDISREQSERLFYAISWPEKFWDEYSEANGRVEMAKVTVRRIDHFLETGE